MYTFKEPPWQMQIDDDAQRISFFHTYSQSTFSCRVSTHIIDIALGRNDQFTDEDLTEVVLDPYLKKPRHILGNIALAFLIDQRPFHEPVLKIGREYVDRESLQQFDENGKSRGVLSRNEERVLFASYDYHKNTMAAQAREIFAAENARRISAQVLKGMVESYENAHFLQWHLITANLGLINSMAGKMHIPEVYRSEFYDACLDCLIKSVKKFDVRLGNKFSTYGCGLMWRSAFREPAKLTKLEKRKVPWDEYQENEGNGHADEDKEDLEIVNRAWEERGNYLDKREVIALEHKFGLGGVDTETLIDTGKRLGGISKERVRQIQKRGIEKIRMRLKPRDLS